MIAGKADFLEVVCNGKWIPCVFFCNRRKADNCIHRSSDIVRHCRKEVCLGLACRFCCGRRNCKLDIEPHKDNQINYQKQK